MEEWAVQHGLPTNLRGKQLLLVDFEDDQACAFFYPGRTHFSQNAFLVALAQFVRRRHGRTSRVTITPDQYQAWLLAEKLPDSEETRQKFIESRYRVEALR
ncbi:MAG TPA: hypothetical protein VFE51_31720 [Verrucomicrobiae bacterium]|nr:hypothetical protein [Verrucomicrobiae bacterium]